MSRVLSCLFGLILLSTIAFGQATHEVQQYVLMPHAGVITPASTQGGGSTAQATIDGDPLSIDPSQVASYPIQVQMYEGNPLDLVGVNIHQVEAPTGWVTYKNLTDSTAEYWWSIWGHTEEWSFEPVYSHCLSTEAPGYFEMKDGQMTWQGHSDCLVKPALLHLTPYQHTYYTGIYDLAPQEVSQSHAGIPPTLVDRSTHNPRDLRKFCGHGTMTLYLNVRMKFDCQDSPTPDHFYWGVQWNGSMSLNVTSAPVAYIGYVVKNH